MRKIFSVSEKDLQGKEECRDLYCFNGEKRKI